MEYHNNFVRQRPHRLPGIISLITALAALPILFDHPEPVLTYLQVVLVTIGIRLLHSLLKRPVIPVLAHSGSGKTRSILADEVRIGLTFLAAAYVLDWPVTPASCAAYWGANVILQVVSHALHRRLSTRRHRFNSANGNHNGAKQVLVVGSGPQARRVMDSALASPDNVISLKGVLDYHRTGLWRYRDVPLVGHPDELADIVAREHLDAILVAVEPRDLPRTKKMFVVAERMGVPVCLLTDVYHSRIARAEPTWFNGTPALLYRTVTENRWSQLAKHLTDRLGAAVGIILAAPVMLLCAAAIKLTSRGPVLFRQKRRGVNGRLFTLFKFRTMCRNAERQKNRVEHLNFMSGPVFKARNDPRVTSVGRILRRWSLDELPQLFNVLAGDMSLVGPRPALPDEVARYEPWQHRRLSVKPGLTCLWQVNGRNHIDFEHWMKMDLEYIDNWSLWLDTKILARTVPAVLKRTGAS